MTGAGTESIIGKGIGLKWPGLTAQILYPIMPAEKYFLHRA